ncbi:MAG: hypothetical protein WC414_02485 [Patescibacteria group bacterium]
MIKISRKNLFKLIIKGSLFIISFFLVLLYPVEIIKFFSISILFFKIYHLVWLIIIIGLLKSLLTIPKNISAGKIYLKYFKENKILTPEKLKIELNLLKKEYNKKVFVSALVTLLVITSFLLFYSILNLNELWIYVFVIFAIFFDSFCVAIWCPFRNYIIKNKCCNSCRIYNWGYLMMFLPLNLIPSFWTYSIIFLSILILIQWEYIHYKHPERFYEISNSNLMCKNCKYSTGFCKNKK